MHTGRLRQLLALGIAALLIASVWRLAWSQEGSRPGRVEQNTPTVALGTAFTYQGMLELNGSAVDDSCDFRFSLWDSATQLTGQVGSSVQKAGVAVVQGQFVIPELDFGATAFGSDARWLEIEVRCPGGSGSYTRLQPRQALTPAPASIYAARAGTVDWGQTWSGPNVGLTIASQATFANSAALRAQSLQSQGTGVQGFVGPANTSASMTVPTGVSGISLAPAGGFANRTYGVYGEAGGTGGYGVYGTGTFTGTVGLADGSSGRGVYGEATGSGGTGVWGAGTNTGVWGVGTNGVYGQSRVSNGTGVLGEANSGSLAFGVWGISSSGYAGYFSGKVNITGNLTKAGGAFLIDHPLDPANMYLAHSFVESPDMKNIYDGVVTLDEKGEVVVTMPDWFEALNQTFRYQLTCIGGYAPVYISREIEGNQFAIAGGTPGLKVSWQVTGIRHDPWAENNRIQVEEEKSPEEAGRYLYPEGYGLSPSYGMTYEQEAALGAVGSAHPPSPLRADDHWAGPVDDAPLPLGDQEGR